MKQGIDICICTYNRVAFLQQCIDGLLPQLTRMDVVLTIIDNNSSDETEEMVLSMIEKNLPVRYFFEPTPGIAFARNRAWQETDHEWIFFIDDDGVPGPGIIETAFHCIENHSEAAAIGGPIYPVFTSSPPSWLPEGFGEFKMDHAVFTIIVKGYIRCGCFLVKKTILDELYGFKTYLGHKGNYLAYGEEIELQDRMRAAGYKIGYVPSLKMGHHVRTEKLNIKWVLQSEYARRRDKMLFTPNTKLKATGNLIRTLGGRIIWTPVYLLRVLFIKKYTLKNAWLDIAKPVAYRWGELVGSIKYKLIHHP